MITLKYSKLDEARFISHIDLLRHMSRILRRAQIPVKMSNGYNPHALVYFSPPLALMVQSSAEYVTIDTPMEEGEAFERFNAAAPSGIVASKSLVLDKNPNLQALIVASDYLYPYPYRDLNFDNFTVEYQKKGETIREDVGKKIFGAYALDGKLVLRLATGSVNIRPDRLLGALNAVYGEDANITDIKKIAQYASVNGVLIDVDDYLKQGLYRK